MKRNFGLIGKTLSYSFSEDYFRKKFSAEEIDGTYSNFELEQIEDFSELPLTDLSGLNVTIPYKELIMPMLDEIDPEAAAIGAVNTIKFVDGQLVGYNTDAPGFRNSIRPYLKSWHQKALILGTGGASRAIAHVLKKMGIEYRFVSRTPDGDLQIGYEELNENALRFFPFIINTTPLGTYPDVNQRPDIPYQFLSKNNFLYDVVYNPEESTFLKLGREQGAQTMNGMRMLENQAELSWKIWNDLI